MEEADSNKGGSCALCSGRMELDKDYQEGVLDFTLEEE